MWKEIDDRPPEITYMCHGLLPKRGDFTKFTNKRGQVFMKETRSRARRDKAGFQVDEAWYREVSDDG